MWKEGREDVGGWDARRSYLKKSSLLYLQYYMQNRLHEDVAGFS